MAAFNSGNFSLPRKIPSKKPYWKGDQGCMVMFRRRAEIQHPAVPVDRCLVEHVDVKTRGYHSGVVTLICS